MNSLTVSGEKYEYHKKYNCNNERCNDVSQMFSDSSSSNRYGPGIEHCCDEEKNARSETPVFFTPWSKEEFEGNKENRDHDCGNDYPSETTGSGSEFIACADLDVLLPRPYEGKSYHVSDKACSKEPETVIPFCKVVQESRHTRIIQFYLNPSELTGKGGRTRESRRFLTSLPRKLSRANPGEPVGWTRDESAERPLRLPLDLSDEVAQQPQGSTGGGESNDLSPLNSPSVPIPEEFYDETDENPIPSRIILNDVDVLLNGGFVE